MISLKPFLSTLAILLTLLAFLPYIHAILNGHTKPHVFSWIIWGTTTICVFFAQLADHAGWGAWPLGFSGVIAMSIAVLAFLRRTDTRITRIDWYFFLTALTALPLWAVTANPLWAVVILTVVDLLGFAPTMRKTYYQPQDENRLFFLLFLLRNLLIIAALEHYSLTTVLFPLSVALACAGLLILIQVRRFILSRHTGKKC